MFDMGTCSHCNMKTPTGVAHQLCRSSHDNDTFATRSFDNRQKLTSGSGDAHFAEAEMLMSVRRLGAVPCCQSCMHNGSAAQLSGAKPRCSSSSMASPSQMATSAAEADQFLNVSDFWFTAICGICQRCDRCKLCCNWQFASKKQRQSTVDWTPLAIRRRSCTRRRTAMVRETPASPERSVLALSGRCVCWDGP